MALKIPSGAHFEDWSCTDTASPGTVVVVGTFVVADGALLTTALQFNIWVPSAFLRERSYSHRQNNRKADTGLVQMKTIVWEYKNILNDALKQILLHSSPVFTDTLSFGELWLQREKSKEASEGVGGMPGDTITFSPRRDGISFSSCNINDFCRSFPVDWLLAVGSVWGTGSWR